MPDIDKTTDIAALTVQLLSAYLANNTVAFEDLSGLIRSTKAALTDDAVIEPVVEEAPTYTPAVSVRKSQSSPEHLLSLIDGKPYKTLKRHLAAHGLTPATYRERYNLPASYPMVAPDFAAKRRSIAEKIGLGSRKQKTSGERAPVVASSDASANEPTVAASVAANDVAPEQVSSVPVAPAKAKGRRVKKPAGSAAKALDAGTAGDATAAASAEPAAPKAPRRKVKVASKPAIAAPAQTEPAAEDAKAPAAPKSTRTRKQKEPAVAAEGSKPAKRGAASSEVTPDTVEPTSSVVAEVPAKRRGKLGLFGKGDTGSKKTAAAASKDGASGEKANAAKVEKPRQTGRPKRMARTPKAASPDAG